MNDKFENENLFDILSIGVQEGFIIAISTKKKSKNAGSGYYRNDLAPEAFKNWVLENSIQGLVGCIRVDTFRLWKVVDDDFFSEKFGLSEKILKCDTILIFKTKEDATQFVLSWDDSKTQKK